MTVGISITLDKRDLERLRDLGKRAPTIVAKALTATAKDAQGTLKGSASGSFHLRNSWVQQGIRIKAATSGNLVAQVGSIDRYMTRHVVGEDKPAGKPLSVAKKRNSKGRLASGGLLIPAYGSIGNVPKHQKTRSKLRRMEGQKRKPFQITSRGGMYVLIVRRTSKKRRPLEVLAKLDTDAEMDRTWPMDTIVEHVVTARFAENFGRQIVTAIEGGKK